MSLHVARSSPSAASSTCMSASATSWCTREGDSPAAAASLRIEIPSARAETKRPHPFPLGGLQPPCGPGNPGQDSPLAPVRLDPLADRHLHVLPGVFRKLDAVAVLTARLLLGPHGPPRVLVHSLISGRLTSPDLAYSCLVA